MKLKCHTDIGEMSTHTVEDRESAQTELSPHLKKCMTEAFKRMGRERVKQAVARHCGPGSFSKSVNFLIALLNAESSDEDDVPDVKQAGDMKVEQGVEEAPAKEPTTKQGLEEAPVLNINKEQDGEMNAKQSLEEASAGNLTKEQDDMLKVKQGQEEASMMKLSAEQPGKLNVVQGLDEAPVERLPMEQTGSSDLNQGEAEATHLGSEERRVAWQGCEDEARDSSVISKEAEAEEDVVIVHELQLDAELVPNAKVEAGATCKGDNSVKVQPGESTEEKVLTAQAICEGEKLEKQIKDSFPHEPGSEGETSSTSVSPGEMLQRGKVARKATIRSAECKEVEQKKGCSEESLIEKIEALETQLRKEAEENDLNKICLQKAEAGMNEQRATIESLEKRLEEKEVALDNAEKELVEIKAEKVVASDEIEGLEKNKVREKIKNKVVEVSQNLMEEGGRFLIAKESRVEGSEMMLGGKSDLMIGKELALVEQNIEQSDEKQKVRIHHPLIKDPKMGIDNQGQAENIARALKRRLLKVEKLDEDNKAVQEFMNRDLFVKLSNVVGLVESQPT